MKSTVTDDTFDAEQLRHAHWKLLRWDVMPADPEGRVFAHLARLPTPPFPAGFTVGVLRAHRERVRAARRLAGRVGAVAALATTACVALAWSAFSPDEAPRLLQAFAQSHALGALGAMVSLSLLDRLLRPTRSTRPAT